MEDQRVVNTSLTHHYAQKNTSRTGWAKEVSYCTFSISLLNIDQFSHFFANRLCKRFATHWPHHTYYVATLPCKI